MIFLFYWVKFIEKSYFEVGKVRYNFCDGQRLEFIPKWYEKWFQKTDDEQRKTITASKIEKTIINNISEKQQEFWRKIGF